MRMIYVTAGLPFHWSETFIVSEILEMKRRGHEITVVPVRLRAKPMHEDAKALLPFTVAEHVVSPRVLAGAVLEFARAPRGVLRALLCLFGSRNLGILVKNLIVFAKGVWLARVARIARIEHIHSHWVSTTATVALVANEVSGIPWSFTAHRWDIAENNLIRRKAMTATFARAIDRPGGAELAARMGEHRKKLRVVHMGVPLVTAAPRWGRVEQREMLRVVMAANLVEKKGHRYALEAIAKVSRRGVNVVLDCAGEGPLSDEVAEYASRVGLEGRVRFLGVVDHDELVRGFQERRWDVALLPSVVTDTGEKEGIPVFLMEAMAAGLPVITTDTGGISELVGGGAGLLVPQRDGDAIAEALVTLAEDPELRKRFGEAGIRRVRKDFGIESVVSDLLELMFGPEARMAGGSVEVR